MPRRPHDAGRHDRTRQSVRKEALAEARRWLATSVRPPGSDPSALWTTIHSVYRWCKGSQYHRPVLSLPIVTPRLNIRPFIPGDAEPMMAVYGDPDVMRYIPGGPLPDVDAVRAIMDEQTLAQAERGYAYYAVELIADGSVVGDAGFGLFEPTGDIELGYTFARRAWGVGYATEAAAACLAAALAGLDVPRVIAVAEVENVASHRVAESIGMRRDGEIDAHGRPHVLFVGERP